MQRLRKQGLCILMNETSKVFIEGYLIINEKLSKLQFLNPSVSRINLRKF